MVINSPCKKFTTTELFKNITCQSLALLLVICSFFIVNPVLSQTAENPKQGSNGSATSPHAVTFQNGNLHSGNAHFLEGYSIPYQLVMTGLTPGDDYIITIGMDALESGAVAIDYVTSIFNLTPHEYFGHAAETINPLEGTGYTEATFGAGNIQLVPIPDPTHSPQAMGISDYFGGGTWVNLDPAKKNLLLYGASAVGTAYYDASLFNPALIGTNTTAPIYISIPFTASGTTAVLAWGGHIASQLDYGLETTAATEIQGAPYHTRRSGFTDGTGTIIYANEGADRSVQIDAIVVCVVTPGEIGGTQSVCTGGDPSVLTNVTAGSATGVLTYQWQSNTTGCAGPWTNIVGATSATYDPPGPATVTTYYRRLAFSDADCNTASNCVTVTVTPNPAAPTTQGGSRCGPGIVALSAGNCAGTLTWYDAAVNGNVVNTGANFSPNVAATTSYWVSCTVNGCISARTQVTATVVAIPAAPTTQGGSRCGPGIVALSAGGCAGTLTWYSAAVGGSVVNTGANFSPNVAATTSYWVSCTVNNCESARTQVTATVVAIPAAPTTQGGTRCGPGIVALSAGGCAGTLTWYSAAIGGSVVNTGANFSPNVAATTSYWVSCTVGDCESGRTQVTATVVAIPAAPTTQGGARCGPGIVALSAGGCAGTLTWYSAAVGGSIVNTGANFSPNVAATTSYWVSCTVGGCESARTQVTATVNPDPILLITNPLEICVPLTVDLTLPAIIAGSNLQGGTITFWRNILATIPLLNPNAVAESGTFYIKVTTPGGCIAIAPVTVSIVLCGEQICTYTQGAYGSEGGKMCNGQEVLPNQFNTFETITNSINSYTVNSYTPPLSGVAPFVNQTLVIGKPGTSVYANSSPAHVNAIIAVLPGGGPSKELIAGDYAINALPGSYLKNGTINNTLLAQTLTLGLNLGIGTNLDNFVLQGGVLVTADAEECGSNTPLVRECVYNPEFPYNLVNVINDYHYHTISAAVVNAIPGSPNTVSGLFELANRALANVDGVIGSEGGVSLSAIAEAVDQINNAFDECKLFVGWDTPHCPETDPTQLLTVAPRRVDNVPSEEVAAKLAVSAFPNPFTDKVRFVLDVPTAGKGSLEVYNTSGQKVGTVYRGYLQAGKGQAFEYTVPVTSRTTNLFYLLRVEGHQASGKLLNIQR